MAEILKLMADGLPLWLKALLLFGIVGGALLHAFKVIEDKYSGATVKAWNGLRAFLVRQKKDFNKLKLPKSRWLRGPFLAGQAYFVAFTGFFTALLVLKFFLFSTWLFFHAMPAQTLAFTDSLKAIAGLLVLSLLVGAFSALTHWQYRRVRRAVASW